MPMDQTLEIPTPDPIPQDIAQIINEVGISEPAPDRPSKAVVGFGYSQSNQLKHDTPVLLDGTDDVLEMAYEQASCNMIALGIIPSAQWNCGGYFTKRPTGILVWEGDSDYPTLNFTWRQLLPLELEKLCLGEPIWAVDHPTYLVERGRYLKGERPSLSITWEARANDRG